MANGRIAASRRARVPGSGPYGGPTLLRGAARAYNALHRESLRRYGVSMELHEGAVGRAYRSYPRQVIAKRLYGGNAATPGTSNHGLGVAVDLATRRQRWVVDRIGARYGFSKRWSDAAWEWWHIKYRPGVYRGRPARYPTLARGRRGPAVRRLQRLLRGKNVHRAPKVTGNFGKATRAAVVRFQRKHKMRADGVVGPRTWRALRR
jgi:hypothetical protein